MHTSFARKCGAGIMALSAAAALAACSSDGDDSAPKSEEKKESTKTSEATPEQPTAAELNEVLT